MALSSLAVQATKDLLEAARRIDVGNTQAFFQNVRVPELRRAPRRGYGGGHDPVDRDRDRGPGPARKSGAPGLGVLAPDGKLIGVASRGEIVKLLEARLLARQ